jgi:hypothetical protein
MSKVEYHASRIERLIDRAAVRVILRNGKARVATVPEVAQELTDEELHQVLRSAYTIATEKAKP